MTLAVSKEKPWSHDAASSLSCRKKAISELWLTVSMVICFLRQKGTKFISKMETFIRPKNSPLLVTLKCRLLKNLVIRCNGEWMWYNIADEERARQKLLRTRELHRKALSDARVNHVENEKTTEVCRTGNSHAQHTSLPVAFRQNAFRLPYYDPYILRWP